VLGASRGDLAHSGEGLLGESGLHVEVGLDQVGFGVVGIEEQRRAQVAAGGDLVPEA